MKTRLASMNAAEANRIPKGGVEQGTSDYVDGKCERAPVQRVMDSDIPAQRLG